ncbi:MAG: type IV toxin-antitoxin system AbiEi family antitoxin domain-containing protein, partial [Deltaproteobacteria bacterium]|nr:type IV toxin-antitoxin system AbiEi family antitoxin domain-containing protein [Deltaproteobacteria bacterium]
MPGRVWEKAFAVAIEQYGYVTFADLERLGGDPVRLRQWHQHGKIERAGHGIYRFPQIPVTPLDPYMLATLWPAGRGVLSHETALDLHDLCDVNPDKIHITLPPNYRPRRRGGVGYVLHRESLHEDAVTRHQGIPVVTPAVAIRQALDGATPRQLVRQAIETARRTGRVPKRVLDKLASRL